MAGWAFAGREEHVTVAAAALAEGRGLDLSGEPGIGKSSLAEEVVARTGLAGDQIMWVVGAPALSRVTFGAMARFHDDDPAPGDDTGDPTVRQLVELHRAIRHRMADTGPVVLGGRRLVIVADDAQWLDEASAAVIAQLAGDGDAAVIVTRRTDQPIPDAIRRLIRTHEHLEVTPLTRAEVSEVLAANLGVVEHQTIEELHVATAGSPLLLAELVRATTSSGALTRRGPGWFWDRTVDSHVRLGDLITDRLATLGPAQLDALTLVAAGEPLPLPVAVEAVGREPLVELERLELVTTVASGDVTLTHPLYGDIVRARCGPIERAGLAARLVDASAAAQPPPEPVRVALWCFDAGTEADPAQLVAASQAAVTAGDGDLALRLAERALAQGERPDALIALGRSLALRDRPDEASAVLADLLELDGIDDRDRVEAAMWAVTAAGIDGDRAAAVVDSVIARLADPREGDVLKAHYAFVLAAGNRWAEAGAIAIPLVHDERDDVAVRAVQPATIALANQGRCTEAAELAATMLPRAIAHNETNPEALRWAFAAAITCGFSDGRLDDVGFLLDLAGGAAMPAGAEGWLSMSRGKLALSRGQVVTAHTELSAALARMAAADADRWWTDWVQGLLVEAAALGSLASGPADELPPFEPHLDFEHFDTQRAQAWGHLLTGDRAGAAEALVAVADAAAALGAVTSEASALYEAVRLGADVGDRFLDLAGRTESRWIPPMVDHVSGLLADDRDRLERAGAGFEAIGANLQAAECWAAAARAAHRAGSAAPSRRAAAQSARCAGRCEGAWTEAMTLPTEAPALTARELHVSRLAASGRRSRDIAVELGISVRTVDNLLARAYTKLGVSGREELALVIPTAG